MELTPQVILLGLVLIGLCLFLDNWQPPIKAQYKFIMLAIVGITLGWFMLGNYQGMLWGFVYTSLVFYKEDLVDYVKRVKNAFLSIKDNEPKEEEIKEDKK